VRHLNTLKFNTIICDYSRIEVLPPPYYVAEDGKLWLAAKRHPCRIHPRMSNAILAPLYYPSESNFSVTNPLTFFWSHFVLRSFSYLFRALLHTRKCRTMNNSRTRHRKVWSVKIVEVLHNVPAIVQKEQTRASHEIRLYPTEPSQFLIDFASMKGALPGKRSMGIQGEKSMPHFSASQHLECNYFGIDWTSWAVFRCQTTAPHLSTPQSTVTEIHFYGSSP